MNEREEFLKEAESVYAEGRRADDLELQGGGVGML